MSDAQPIPTNRPAPEAVAPLLDLLAELTNDSAGYLTQPDAGQQWYNRGYANGIAAALRTLGYAEAVAATVAPDPYDGHRDQAALPWGRAYEHGREKGMAETFEVL